VDIIELGDRAWDLCAEEEKTAMESEQMLYSTLLLALKEDFGIILEETPTFTLMEDETVEEMMQEELVWRSEMERYTSDLYSLSDEAFAVGGAPRDDQLDRGGKFSKEFDYNQITIWLYTVLLLPIKRFFFTLQNGIQRGRVR
jgi:hypothetical protein